ncbi:MAG: beta-L-arabinofuranosidase domain-containing protein [Candidatus Hydrogenedentota bacterium]
MSTLSATTIALVLTTIHTWDPGAISHPNTTTPTGDTRELVEQARARLCSPPLNDAKFVLSDVSFAVTRRFNRYSGDISGRMLGALGLADAMLGTQSPLLDTLIDHLPRYQKPDGHFGKPQDLAAEINQDRDMPILWGNGRLLRAMAEQVMRVDNPELRASAIALGDYIRDTRPYYGKPENFEEVGGLLASGFTTCYPSLIDGLVALGVATDEERFLDEAHFIGQLSLDDQDLARRHSHGRLTAFRGMLELDMLRDARDFIPAIEKTVVAIQEEYALPTGGIPELFDTTYNRDEGCSEADWIWVQLLLWKATGNTQYLDRAAFVLRNHLFATQFPHGGFGHYVFERLKNGLVAYRGAAIDNWASDSYWCCSMHGTQLAADLANWAVLTQDDAILLPLLAEAEASVTVNGVPVQVAVSEPTPGQWTIEVTSAHDASLTLKVRQPGNLPAIQVNGKARDAKDGWVSLTHTAHADADADADAIRVALPRTIVRTNLAGEPPALGEPMLVRAGEDLYALEDPVLPKALRGKDTVPRLAVLENPMDTYRPGALTALLQTSEPVYEVPLTPLAKRLPGRCRYLFLPPSTPRDALEKKAVAGGVSTGEPYTIQVASESPYDIYINGVRAFHHAGWSESPERQCYLPPDAKALSIAVAVQANTEPAGFMARIDGQRFSAVSTPSDWKVYRVAHAPGDALDPATLAEKKRLPTKDLGPLGIPPFFHIPGHYHGSGAHWLWAKDDAEPEPETRYIFLWRKP